MKITREEYLKALDVVKIYRQQIEDEFYEIKGNPIISDEEIICRSNRILSISGQNALWKLGLMDPSLKGCRIKDLRGVRIYDLRRVYYCGITTVNEIKALCEAAGFRMKK